MADSIIQTLDKDIWQPIENFFNSAEKVLVGDIGTLVQEGLQMLSTAETQAADQLTAAQAKVDSTINPIVDGFLKAGAATLEATAPSIAPIIAAGEPVAETAANGVLDAVALKLISTLAGLLSDSAKSTAAVNLSNLAGAVA